MPRNGSGTYTRPQADYTPGTTILATSVNSDLNDMASALTASIARDGQTTPTGNLPMGAFRHTNVANAANRNEYAALGQVQDGAFLWGGTAGGTANAITVSLNPPITAYAAGQMFQFIASAANTGAVTLNVNSLGAVALNKGDGTAALIAGDIPNGAMVTARYDGTRFRLIDPVPIVNLSMASAQILGRVSAGTGPVEQIPLGNAAAALSLGINRGTEQATTSGTAIDFTGATGIPAGVRRVTVLLNAVSTNGASNLALRLGTSGGIVSTGYSGIFGYWGTVSSAYGVLSSSFNLSNGSASDVTTGRFVFENISGNNWIGTFNGTVNNGVNIWVAYCSGVIALGGVLDRLRLTTDTGTPTFDAGAMNIMWEF